MELTIAPANPGSDRNNTDKMKIQITNAKTGEKTTISRDVCTQHPNWVHEQCGTTSESELQALLDGLNVSMWYRDGNHLGQDASGIEMFKDYSEYTVKISSEPSYYGSECTQQDSDRIVDSLGSLISAEFPGIEIEDYVDGRGSSKTTGPDESVIEEINAWISDNWTAAL